MTLITFNTLKEKLISGEKKQTIRQNVPYWSKRLNKNTKLDIWWLNPRNQHPDCYKMWIAQGKYTIKRGYGLSKKDAQMDGFDTLDELLNTLMSLHKLTLSKALTAEWIIITWE